MNKFYHVGTLAHRDVTTLLHTLTHNAAANAEGILNYVGSKLNPYDPRKEKAKARHTLRRVKKALKVGRIPLERKRPAKAVLTGATGYSAGRATRQGSSSPTRFTGQSAITFSTCRR